MRKSGWKGNGGRVTGMGRDGGRAEQETEAVDGKNEKGKGRVSGKERGGNRMGRNQMGARRG